MGNRYAQTQPVRIRREPCLTINEVASHLGITVNQAKSLRKRHAIQSTGLGGRWTGRTYHLSSFQKAINEEKGETVYEVRMDVPLPPVHTKRGTIYAEPVKHVVDLPVGGMLELPADVAIQVMNIIRREHQTRKYATRKLTEETRGVWRLS